jgi:thiol-disulfide isomerase/thioredoxin
MRLKKIISITVLLSASLLLISCTAPKPAVVQDSDGRSVSLSDHPHQWLVINYWAGWCKPCYQEMPALNAFYQAHVKKHDLMMLGVNYDHAPAAQLAALIKRVGVQFPTLTSDPAKQLGIAHVPGLPATFIFTATGKLQNTLLGEQTEKTLEAALAGTKP